MFAIWVSHIIIDKKLARVTLTRTSKSFTRADVEGLKKLPSPLNLGLDIWITPDTGRVMVLTYNISCGQAWIRQAVGFLAARNAEAAFLTYEPAVKQHLGNHVRLLPPKRR